ncbi:hypothetical protein RRG08_062607 [Elysia crispata]|uniref:Uncharacterized protein n=1 Tax=Elysia crispata TaxID=231223 RepID=A0AAE0YYV0_9GAST|nr:hypothetical protein RRG08_062607 [Elysia crispata]
MTHGGSDQRARSKRGCARGSHSRSGVTRRAGHGECWGTPSGSCGCSGSGARNRLRMSVNLNRTAERFFQSPKMRTYLQQIQIRGKGDKSLTNGTCPHLPFLSPEG